MRNGEKDTEKKLSVNRKASHDYFIEERLQAGMVLEGWEAKAIRAGRASVGESYVVIKNGEALLVGMQVTPLLMSSTHVKPDPTRTRKLLLSRREIDTLTGKVERAGYALIPLDLHLCRGRVKLAIGLAKGKKKFDKRESERESEAKREASRAMKVSVRG